MQTEIIFLSFFGPSESIEIDHGSKVHGAKITWENNSGLAIQQVPAKSYA